MIISRHLVKVYLYILKIELTIKRELHLHEEMMKKTKLF